MSETSHLTTPSGVPTTCVGEYSEVRLVRPFEMAFLISSSRLMDPSRAVIVRPTLKDSDEAAEVGLLGWRMGCEACGGLGVHLFFSFVEKALQKALVKLG